VKVTSVRAICGSRMHEPSEQWLTWVYRSVKADIAVVVIETDDGQVGMGEACAYGNPRLIADWVAWLEPTLLGRDVEDPEVVPRPIGTEMSGDRNSAYDFAVAGIDTAIWDLRGKNRGTQVRHLLNPNPDSDVKTYASGGVKYDWAWSPETLVDDVRTYVESGYDQIKIRLGTAWEWDRIGPTDFLRLFDLVREGVGPNIAIAVDANCRLNRDDARTLALGLQERGASWLEEPLDKGDLEGYSALAKELEMPISGGESLTTLAQFRTILELEALDIVQPDVGMCGISEAMKIGELAARHGVQLIPHSWHNGLMAVANAHVVAALGNAPMVEECMVQGPLKWGVIEGGTKVTAGRLQFGSDPGLGVKLVEDLEKTYPYIEGHYSVTVTR